MECHSEHKKPTENIADMTWMLKKWPVWSAIHRKDIHEKRKINKGKDIMSKIGRVGEGF